jgi:Protein of unknown function (DUF4238)
LASPTEQLRDRKDHWLPQGYLRGFIGPSSVSRFKPLCCFYVHTQQWENVSPKQIAYGEGFYDYADGTDYSTVTHPDSAFARLERDFPLRRDEMTANAFAGWQEHKGFLLEFMQMVRARSPLAMQQREAETRNLRGATVTGVSPDKRTITLDSLELRPLPERAIRNFTISRMLQDVKAGVSWMSDFNWCLRYTDAEDESFCTTDQAIFVEGKIESEQVTMDLLRHQHTLLFFPLCWQACLFGSSRPFDKAYDRADPRDINALRGKQKRCADRFVVSPVAF